VLALKTKRYDVVDAPDGDIGVKMAREEHPDLILCDVMMHSVNGYEVLQELRRSPDTSSTPFILMTARSDRDSMRYGMKLGADDFITKPFTTQELLETIQTRLERREVVVRDAERSLDQTRQQLVHMITHELRTPLTSINMTMDIISRQLNQLDETQLQDLMGALGTGSKRLSRIVDQVVLLSQVQSGAISANSVRDHGIAAPLSEIVAGGIGMGRRFAFRNQGVGLDLNDHAQKVRLHCNPQALKHAFAELVSNALGFSPENKVVTVMTWNDRTRAYVSIEDHGPGIAADQIDRALELFQQINREQQEQQGMGLGLGLAHHIIEAHGGTLDLRSEPGHGTTITVALPVASD
jgi:signal transduction histidine kinase